MYSPLDNSDGSDLHKKTLYMYAHGNTLDFEVDDRDRRSHPNTAIDIDPEQTYNYNSMWFRTDDSCKELSSDTEVVFAGCSFTEGIGVPEDMTWGAVLSRNLGMSYSNLGKSGTSSYQIVKTLFAYFRQYGNPKYLFCLFPDYNRFAAATAPGLFSNETSIGYDPTMPGIYNGYAMNTGRTYLDAPKYLKRPYDLNEVNSSEQAFMLNGVAISSLIQYCRAAGIKFRWSTWSRSFSTLVEHSDQNFFDFEGYVSTENTKWHLDRENPRNVHYHTDYFSENIHGTDSCEDRSCALQECLRHSDLEAKYPNNFHAGTDNNGRDGNCHWGVHRHTHIAEEFMKALL